jgi:hypothetical protein
LHLIIFEDALTQNLQPITLTRPTFDMILGTKTLLQSLLDDIKPERCSLLVSEYLAPIISKKFHDFDVNPSKIEGKSTFINGLIRRDLPEIKKILLGNRDFVAFSGNNVAIAKVNSKVANEALIPPSSLSRTFVKKFKGVTEEINLANSALIRYPWQLIHLNHFSIIEQISKINTPSRKDLQVTGPASKLFVNEDVEIEQPVFFDTREGPIHIDANTKIEAFTKIRGPAYVGKKSNLCGCKIQGGTTVGDFVNLGGEVNKSIIAGHSTMPYAGYLKHSYIGQWVDFGALTSTSGSDLLDSYDILGSKRTGDEKESDTTKFVCLIADYVKTSIGTFIYAGNKIGVASHINGYVDKDIPSFTVNSNSSQIPYHELNIEFVTELQKRMMYSKGFKQITEDSKLLQKIFMMTQKQRYENGVLKEKP